MNLGDRVQLINSNKTYIVIEFFLGYKKTKWARLRNENTGNESEHPIENLIDIGKK